MRLTSLTNALSSYTIPSNIPIIKTPAYLQNAATKVKQKMAAKQREVEHETAKRRELKKNPILIECKDGKLNHYRGKMYPKFEKVPLVSNGWRSGKSFGDYFVIKASGDNPAFRNVASKDEEGSRAKTWADTRLHPAVIEQIENLGFLRPTNIQCDAIPALLENDHCLISAETGSGKTLAYLLPLLHTIQCVKETENREFGVPRVNKPLGMIVTPGRELAAQVADVIRRFEGLANTHLVIGGSFLKKIRSIEVDQVDVVIGTVGMLGKFFMNNVYDTSCVRSVVLDETDALVDRSFIGKTRKILENFFAKDRAPGVQTNLCLVGATIPENVDELCGDMLPVANFHRVISPFVHRVMPHVEQKFVRVSKAERAERLLELVKPDAEAGVPTIVFSSKAATADWVSMFLNENGVRVVNHNAEMYKNIRDENFGLFKSGAVPVLSCTDLGSRGLDLSMVKHIVNFDFPRSLSDYIHRCGRVGRVGGQEHCRMTSFVWKKQTLPIVQAVEFAVRKGVALDEVKLENHVRPKRRRQ